MALQHLRSSTANKRPVPGNMSDGQLGINTNLASPGLFFKDTNGDLVKVGPVHVGTTAPNASPAAGGTAGNSVGEQWLDTTGGTYVFKVWDGSAWRSESGTFVDVNGDVMTGALGIIAGSAGSPGLYFSGDTNTGIYSPGADQVAISTAGSGRLFVDGSGNVGIGTTGPEAILHAQDSNAFGVQILAKQTASTAGVCAIRAQSNSASVDLMAGGSNYGANYMDQDEAGLITQAAGDSMRFNIGGSYCRWTFGSSEKARIDSSGRLLVGTSSARSNFFGSQSAAFQVEGNLGVGSVGQIISHVYGESAALGGPYFVLGKHRSGSIGGTTLVASNDQLGAVSFTGADGTNFIEGARIQAFVDGTPGANDMPSRLVFSTTADGASSPTERMRITNAGLHYFMADGNDTSRIQNTAAAGTAVSFLAAYHSSTAGAVNTGTLSLNITTNGNITNTNNSYGAISDIKLKENIVDAGSQWNDLKSLQVRKYNFKDGQTHTQIGLIAQEVELVSPGLVSESPDRDADGNDLGTVTKSVNYSVLYMKAVKALQEAMERIEQLEQRLAAAGI